MAATLVDFANSVRSLKIDSPLGPPKRQLNEYFRLKCSASIRVRRRVASSKNAPECGRRCLIQMLPTDPSPTAPTMP